VTILQPNQTLAVIGCGTMGEAIVRGILAKGALPPTQIIASDLRPAVVKTLTETHGIRATTDNLRAATEGQVALLCVKPYQLASLLADPGMQQALENKVVISIAAGVRLEKLSGLLPKSRVIRVMPNTPALIGEGMAALCRAPGVPDEAMGVALALFSSVGKALEIDEAQMDVVTAVSGSGPAFMFVMIDALADGAVKMGLRRDLAVAFVAQTMQGAARMVAQTGAHPGVLKDQVTTPGGCTAAGLATLEDGKIRSVLARTIEDAARSAAKLG
jgi:pyrroline-5-carboxylate reductase